MADTQSSRIPSHVRASTMPKLHELREFLSERLTAAALEIFGAVEETLADYHEEICRSNEEIVRLQRLLAVVTQPEIKIHRLETKQASVPEVPQIDEPQEQWVSQGGEQQQQQGPESVFNPEDCGLTSPTVNRDSSLTLHLYQTPTVGNREDSNREIKTEPSGEGCGGPGRAVDSLPFLVFSPEDERGEGEVLPESKHLHSKSTLSQESKRFRDHTDLWNTSGQHGLFDPEPGTSSPGTPVTSSSSSSVLPARSWPANFRVNWDRMSVVIQNAVASHQRPLPVDRRQMVRMLVDQMREYDLNPSRAICLSVAQSIVLEYPESFSDVREDGAARNACASLLSQIKTRVEHVNRHNNMARRRRGRKSHSETGEASVCRGPQDRYGCVRWQPEDLPPGQTEETLEDLRRRMLQLYSQEGTAAAEKGELCKWLEMTYVLQRRHLNRIPAPPVADVKDGWPFLFSPSGLYSHFHLLTDIPIQLKLPEAFEGTGQKIFQFFRAMKTNPGVEEVLSAFQENENNDTVMCFLLLILAHFKEPDWGIFLQADPSATVADVELSVPLPDTPRLIVQGDTLMNPMAWMLSIEGQVVMGPHTNIVHGIAALFASYYTFNLQYPLEAACTLEFIQRGFVGINPETGSKATAGKVVNTKTGKVVERKRNAINPHVCTLLRKLMDFEWFQMQPQLFQLTSSEQEYDSLSQNSGPCYGIIE